MADIESIKHNHMIALQHYEDYEAGKDVIIMTAGTYNFNKESRWYEIGDMIKSNPENIQEADPGTSPEPNEGIESE